MNFCIFSRKKDVSLGILNLAFLFFGAGGKNSEGQGWNILGGKYWAKEIEKISKVFLPVSFYFFIDNTRFLF